jgi:hypothetical protein
MASPAEISRAASSAAQDSTKAAPTTARPNSRASSGGVSCGWGRPANRASPKVGARQGDPKASPTLTRWRPERRQASQVPTSARCASEEAGGVRGMSVSVTLEPGGGRRSRCTVDHSR